VLLKSANLEDAAGIGAIMKMVDELDTATVGPRGTRTLKSDLTALAKDL